jgi:hypothetical protein
MRGKGTDKLGEVSMASCRSSAYLYFTRHREASALLIHYVPTSCSWLNLKERWFAELTNKRIRRGSFLGVADLVATIEEFLAAWTATVDSIVARVARCRQTLEQVQPGRTLPKSKGPSVTVRFLPGEVDASAFWNRGCCRVIQDI